MQLLFAILVGLPLIAGWFCFVCFLLSRLGGWAALARTYRATTAPEGARFLFQSGHFGSTRYNSCLDVFVGQTGLYLRVFPLFRFGHPPLLIPWSELTGLREKRLMFWRFVEMEVGKPAISTVILPMHLIEQRPEQ